MVKCRDKRSTPFICGPYSPLLQHFLALSTDHDKHGLVQPQSTIAKVAGSCQASFDLHLTAIDKEYAAICQKIYTRPR